MNPPRLVYRIGSVALPLAGVAAAQRGELAAALERALAAGSPAPSPDLAGRAEVSLPGGRVTVDSGASVEDVAAAIAALVRERVARGGAA